MARRPLGRDELRRRRSERVGAVGVLVAAALPVVLWRHVIADLAEGMRGQRWTVVVAGWAPWALMVLGLACAIPVAIERWRTRDGRFYSQGAAAWTGWGVTLYILGFGLATQVAQIHGLHSA
jgi:hypothetical protein